MNAAKWYGKRMASLCSHRETSIQHQGMEYLAAVLFILAPLFNEHWYV